MTHSQQPFIAETFPLTGRRLIEASAGTGKTYNIANLYLRLLLGDENRAPLTVDQILVVTFTRAATSELRGRIRAKIEEALQEYRKNDDGAQAARLLNAALVCMDEAAIFTIHGFAVRVIQTFLFETGALADVELTEGDNAKKSLLMADVWRQLQMNDEPEVQAFFAALGFKQRDDFEKYYASSAAQAVIRPAFVIHEPLPPLAAVVPQLNQYVKAICEPVLQERKQLNARWLDCIAGISEKQLTADIKDIFDNPIPGKEKSNTSVGTLFKKITEWFSVGTNDLKMPGGDIATRIDIFLTKPHTTPLAETIRDILLHAQSCSVSEDVIKQNGSRALLLQWLQTALSVIDLSAMQLDDVVRLINNKLQAGDVSATALRQAITASYPVCMVDEFQDTDPEQFAMFNNLYAHVDQAGFFMIGDPKQSIYAFRGADIFSYLGVRETVAAEETVSGEKNIYSLDTNFRSKKNLVTAANALFREKDEAPTFVFPGIAYHPVNSCEDTHPDKNKGEYAIKNGPLAGSASLVFVGNPESELRLNAEGLRRQFALDTAQRIASLLNPASEATIHKLDAAPDAVKARDIAILVKTGTEARVMREALLKQTPAIGSVYQSQRDSVFSSALFAEDLYHILCAMDDPSSKSTLKAALATPLFRGLTNDFSLLDTIENDDAFFEQLIAEFSAYRQQWDQYGVLSSLNALMSKRELAQCFAQQPDGDRLITDFRHLGELLQQYYLECGSREQLLIWYARQLHNDSDIDEDAKRIRLESDDNLVKIVTIHVSKGLEYPIVFLPFFFLPKQQDSSKKIPLYHQELDQRGYQAVVDFSSDASIVDQQMQIESLAEDLRLLYVAVTRAIYQCYIGISASTSRKTPQFQLTVWAHLLGVNEIMPSWSVLRAALQNKMAGCDGCVTYAELFDAIFSTNTVEVISDSKALINSLEIPDLNPSSWVITSYSALAQAKKDPGLRSGGSDELFLAADSIEQDDVIENDQRWLTDIRYRLKGSNKTGDCLHALYEQIALEPARYLTNTQELQWLVRDSLRRHGLEQPERQDMSRLSEAEKSAALVQRCNDVANWISTTLDANILQDAHVTLRSLFADQQALPELDFDFALGAVAPAQVNQGINRILNTIGVAGIQSAYMHELEGLMTGSIDLMFIHEKKVYVLDYKSNTLGKAPRFYNQQNMTEAMQHSRYDLQYLIYSVAAHRYMQQRLGDRYEFEAGEYSFGGVIYLFLRGMGVPDYPQHGIWFHKPQAQHILALDAAFNGEGGQ
jgi:exodeoxyribonuclease V beta subunit